MITFIKIPDGKHRLLTADDIVSLVANTKSVNMTKAADQISTAFGLCSTLRSGGRIPSGYIVGIDNIGTMRRYETVGMRVVEAGNYFNPGDFVAVGTAELPPMATRGTYKLKTYHRVEAL